MSQPICNMSFWHCLENRNQSEMKWVYKCAINTKSEVRLNVFLGV